MRLIHFPGHHVEHENVWSNSWNTQYIPSRPARRKHYRSHKTRSGNVYSESWNTNSKPRVERENVASNSRDTHSKPSRPSAKALSNSWNTQSKQACPAQRMYDPTHGKRNPSKLVQRKEGMIQLMEHAVQAIMPSPIEGVESPSTPSCPARRRSDPTHGTRSPGCSTRRL